MRVTNTTQNEGLDFAKVQDRLTGTQEKNEEATKALQDVYEKADDGKRVVERFLARAGSDAQIRSQMILKVYKAVENDPQRLKTFLMRDGFATFRVYEDG